MAKIIDEKAVSGRRKDVMRRRIKKVQQGWKKICFLLCLGAAVLGLSGCDSEKIIRITPTPAPAKEADLTIMHVNSSQPEVIQFMKEAEEELGISIRLLESPDNADNRHARVSTILKSGDDSVDIITVNDEMISDFKGKGYLHPLGDEVMTEEVRSHYPEDYLKEMCMLDGEIYSVPYQMDVMCFWVNEQVLKQGGISQIRTLDDLNLLAEGLKSQISDNGNTADKEITDVYAYGDAWETTYIYNSISQFINLYGGDYRDWSSEKTRKAIRKLKEMMDTGVTSDQQLVDQYEQMEQKFIDGKYGSIFMYSGAAMIFVRSGKYGPDQIHIAPMPQTDEYAANIATWQYVLNNSSKHKEASIRFLNYIADKAGATKYANRTGCFPARLDVMDSPDFLMEGAEEICQYLKNAKLCARPMSSNSMLAISESGKLFQKYLLGEMEEDEFCNQMQKVVEQYYMR